VGNISCGAPILSCSDTSNGPYTSYLTAVGTNAYKLMINASTINDSKLGTYEVKCNASISKSLSSSTSCISSFNLTVIHSCTEAVLTVSTVTPTIDIIDTFDIAETSSKTLFVFAASALPLTCNPTPLYTTFLNTGTLSSTALSISAANEVIVMTSLLPDVGTYSIQL
jgi:hypothetical protein